MPNAEVLESVLELIRSLNRTGTTVHAQSSLLTDIDLDSLQMLELIERIKEQFGVDLLAAPFSMPDATSPAKIAEAIERHRTAAAHFTPTQETA